MGFSAAKIVPHPPYTPLGTIEIREGFGPLELSQGFSTVCRTDPFLRKRRSARFFLLEICDFLLTKVRRGDMIFNRNFIDFLFLVFKSCQGGGKAWTTAEDVCRLTVCLEVLVQCRAAERVPSFQDALSFFRHPIV